MNLQGSDESPEMWRNHVVVWFHVAASVVTQDAQSDTRRLAVTSHVPKVGLKLCFFQTKSVSVAVF